MGNFRSGPLGALASFAFACAMLSPCAAQTQFPPVQPQQNPPDTPAQYPAGQNPTVQDPNAPRPLTPEEKRQQEIDRYNPLSPVSPTRRALPGDPKPAAAAPGTTDTPRPKPQADAQAAPVIPGSVADSNQAPRNVPGADGPQVVTGNEDANANADQQNYNGPAVLSRSYTISRPMDSKEVKWTWTAGQFQIYQSGLVGGAATTANAATTGNSFGTGTNFTFAGRHFWKRDQIGITYAAAYNKYFSSYGYDGTNQNLSLDYEHYFTRHLSMNLVENGSMLSQNSTLQNPLAAPGVNAANIDLAASPTVQVLDQRVRQFQTTAGLTWQMSARLSFNLSQGFFAVDRTGVQLISGTGYQSQADVNYRLSSRTTVGAYYSYTSYLYTKHENSSDSHTVGGIYSYAFNRTTQVRVRAGITRIESLAYTEIPIDPIFAVLVGQSFGIVDSYYKTYTTDFSGQFIKDFGRKRTANIAVTRGIAPGNGLILTSVQQVINGTYATNLFHTYTLSFTGGRSTLSAEGQGFGSYSSNYFGVNLTHAIPRGPAATFAFNYRTFTLTNMPGIQRQISVSSGITWSPGPGRLW